MLVFYIALFLPLLTWVVKDRLILIRLVKVCSLSRSIHQWRLKQILAYKWLGSIPCLLILTFIQLFDFRLSVIMDLILQRTQWSTVIIFKSLVILFGVSILADVYQSIRQVFILFKFALILSSTFFSLVHLIVLL